MKEVRTTPFFKLIPFEGSKIALKGIMKPRPVGDQGAKLADLSPQFLGVTKERMEQHYLLVLFRRHDSDMCSSPASSSERHEKLPSR